MIDKRLLLALPALALLAACGGSKTSENDGRAASGEVLEGTISDEMLPVDQVRSEPPLEDPEAFAKAISAAEGTAAPAQGEDGAERATPAPQGTPGATPEATTGAGDE